MKNGIRLLFLVFLISSLLVAGYNKVAQPPIEERKQNEPTTSEKTPEITPEKTPETTPETKPVPVPVIEVVPAAKPGDFFPLVAGSIWEYQGEGNEFRAEA